MGSLTPKNECSRLFPLRTIPLFYELNAVDAVYVIIILIIINESFAQDDIQSRGSWRKSRRKIKGKCHGTYATKKSYHQQKTLAQNRLFNSLYNKHTDIHTDIPIENL